MGTPIIQAGGNVNLVQELRDSLRLDKTKLGKLNKPKILQWMIDTDFLDKYEVFHGSDARDEMLSAIKSLKKGKHFDLPLSIAGLKRLKLPKIKIVVTDFLNDIGIQKDFNSWSKKRLNSFIRRHKYAEMLGKRGQSGSNVQVQVVNNLKDAKSDEILKSMEGELKKFKEDYNNFTKGLKEKPKKPAQKGRKKTLENNKLAKRVSELENGQEKVTAGMKQLQLLVEMAKVKLDMQNLMAAQSQPRNLQPPPPPQAPVQSQQAPPAPMYYPMPQPQMPPQRRRQEAWEAPQPWEARPEQAFRAREAERPEQAYRAREAESPDRPMEGEFAHAPSTVDSEDDPVIDRAQEYQHQFSQFKNLQVVRDLKGSRSPEMFRVNFDAMMDYFKARSGWSRHQTERMAQVEGLMLLDKYWQALEDPQHNIEFIKTVSQYYMENPKWRQLLTPILDFLEHNKNIYWEGRGEVIPKLKVDRLDPLALQHRGFPKEEVPRAFRKPDPQKQANKRWMNYNIKPILERIGRWQAFSKHSGASKELVRQAMYQGIEPVELADFMGRYWNVHFPVRKVLDVMNFEEPRFLGEAEGPLSPMKDEPLDSPRKTVCTTKVEV